VVRLMGMSSFFSILVLVFAASMPLVLFSPELHPVKNFCVFFFSPVRFS